MACLHVLRASLWLQQYLWPMFTSAAFVIGSQDCFLGPVLPWLLPHRPQMAQQVVCTPPYVSFANFNKLKKDLDPTKLFKQDGFLTAEVTNRIKARLSGRKYLAENIAWSIGSHILNTVVRHLIFWSCFVLVKGCVMWSTSNIMQNHAYLWGALHRAPHDVPYFWVLLSSREAP